MRKGAMAGPVLLLATLAACGSDPAPEPVEQIVVRERGEVAEPKALPSREPGAPPFPAAVGEQAFASCSGCHVAQEGAPSMAGPNLYGVFGRKAGSLDDFAYSEALSGSDITWDIASLDKFLANPDGYVPGTSMAAGAVTDVEKRAAIVAYLRSLNE